MSEQVRVASRWRWRNELRIAEVYAVDLSADALEIATRQCGAAAAGRASEVSAEQCAGSDWPSVSASFHDFDFVVSNPPYVGKNEADKVQRSVIEFEPQDGGVFRRERTGCHSSADCSRRTLR